MENKTAHWSLEAGDLDEVHCSSCDYATREVMFFKEDDGKIYIMYPKNCKQCGAEMINLNIVGKGTEKALRETINNGNGRYSMLKG